MATAVASAAVGVAVPSLEDARRGADVVVRAVGGDVLVFVYGSVARGDAREGSDIDLYAVFADLDYAERYEVARRLGAALSEVANGHRFDLHVTDVPEWEGRRRVSNAFEHAIAKDAVLLCGEISEANVNRAKAQVKPMTASDEAQRFLDNILWSKLGTLGQHAVPLPWESPPLGTPLFGVTAEEQNEERQEQELAELRRLRRMTDLVAAAALSIELSLKAATVLQGAHPESGKQVGHDIEKGIAAVAEPLRSELAALVVGHGLDPEEISGWRVTGTYDIQELLQATADEFLYDYLDTALDVAARVVDEFAREGANTGRLREEIAAIADLRNRGRLRRDDQIDPEAQNPWG